MALNTKRYFSRLGHQSKKDKNTFVISNSVTIQPLTLLANSFGSDVVAYSACSSSVDGPYRNLLRASEEQGGGGRGGGTVDYNG